MEGTIVVNIFAFKSLNAMNYKFLKMLVLTVLALAVAVEGYRLNRFDTFERSPPSPPSPMGVNMIRKMCIENGANYTAVETAAVEFVTCMETDFEVKSFENELKEALMYNTYHALSGVFKKYCRKTPEMKACYHKMVKEVAPCFGNEKEDMVKISNNINDKILDYICEDDGVIVTRFIMEGGPQCFQQKTYDIMVCSEMAKNSFLSMDHSSSISVNASYRVYDDLINCILQSVETCHNSISSRIVKKVSEIIKQSISEEVINASERVPTENIGNESTTTDTTDRGWYNPTTSTERYRYRPRTSTERYWHRPTTSTERYWYKPTTTTEQAWNRVNTAWQNGKDLPTNGNNNNLQELFGNHGIEFNTDQETKNITCGSLKKLFKLSGTLNVAFNGNLYI